MLYTSPQYLVFLWCVTLWLQLLKAEDDIQCLKNDNSHMNQAGQASSQEIGQLQDQLHQIELELTISQEKHRTCQKEVRPTDRFLDKHEPNESLHIHDCGIVNVKVVQN